MNIQSFNENIEFDSDRVKTKIILETSFSKEIQILMKNGDIIALESHIPHDFTATENSIIWLSLSKFDKVERLKSVLNK